MDAVPFAFPASRRPRNRSGRRPPLRTGLPGASCRAGKDSFGRAPTATTRPITDPALSRARRPSPATTSLYTNFSTIVDAARVGTTRIRSLASQAARGSTRAPERLVTMPPAAHCVPAVARSAWSDAAARCSRSSTESCSAGPPVIDLLVNDPEVRGRRSHFAADSTLQLLSTSMVDRLGADLQKLGFSRTGRTASARSLDRLRRQWTSS